VHVNWGELWEYRELLYFFAWRDIKVRYKQTAVGAAWAILQPLLSMVVFTLFFGRLAHVPSNGLPYPIFSYAGLLPWQLFSYSLTNGSTSLVTNERVISKAYFPRLLVPASTVVAGLLDLGIAFIVLLGMMGYYGIVPSWHVVTLPLFVLLAVATAVGMALWLSALDVQYRDVRYTLPFLAQLWLFATPVVYPSSILPEPWRTVYGLNPMAGVVEGFRWALLGNTPPPGPMLAVSVLAVVGVFAGGLFFFRRMERTMADVV
jgi:lipopolysaccharide transport system permease protein